MKCFFLFISFCLSVFIWSITIAFANSLNVRNTQSAMYKSEYPPISQLQHNVPSVVFLVTDTTSKDAFLSDKIKRFENQNIWLYALRNMLDERKISHGHNDNTMRTLIYRSIISSR